MVPIHSKQLLILPQVLRIWGQQVIESNHSMKTHTEKPTRQDLCRSVRQNRVTRKERILHIFLENSELFSAFWKFTQPSLVSLSYFFATHTCLLTNHLPYKCNVFSLTLSYLYLPQKVATNGFQRSHHDLESLKPHISHVVKLLITIIAHSPVHLTVNIKQSSI